MDFTEGRPGKGGEWVMTSPAGEPMILPYDPQARDPQPSVFVTIFNGFVHIFKHIVSKGTEPHSEKGSELS